MSENELSAAEALATSLEREWWVDDTSVDEETGDIELATSEAPDLRNVYQTVERLGVTGKVTVDGPSGSWAVEYQDGEVRHVERVGGAYTVQRMSLLERFFQGLNMFGMYVIFAAIVTAVASFFFTTPLTLVDVGTLLGVAGMLGTGILCVVIGIIGFVITPGLSHGETKSDPGDGISGFGDLSATARAALIAPDDAKSERNRSFQLKRSRTLGLVGAFGFAAYLGVIGYLTAGAIGLLVVCGLFAIRTLLQVVGTLLRIRALDPLQNRYLNELHEEIREAGDLEAAPTIYGYGDESNPIHENVAAAAPELDAILVPLADVEKLNRDEMKAILAHEHKHVQSHYPLVLTLFKAVLLLVPGIALIVSTATPSALVVGGALFAYFAVVNAVLAIFRRRWEDQADDFAGDVASPLGLAFGLTRVTDQHVIDANSSSILSGPTGELYGSHPYPHRRITRLIEDARE